MISITVREDGGYYKHPAPGRVSVLQPQQRRGRTERVCAAFRSTRTTGQFRLVQLQRSGRPNRRELQVLSFVDPNAR
jgi:hypothetical protein